MGGNLQGAQGVQLAAGGPHGKDCAAAGASVR
jgi:hypothetical protein